MIALPYPNPDLSTITSHNTLIDSDSQPNPTPARRISALPSRAQTPFKLFKPQPSPLAAQSALQFENQQFQSPTSQPIRSPLTNKSTNRSSLANGLTSPKDPKNSSHPEAVTSPARAHVSSPNKVNFPTPSAAISDIFKNQDQPIVPSSATIDQVMAELENRTEAGPRITKITFQDQQNSQATQPTNGRFAEAHGKQFARVSILVSLPLVYCSSDPNYLTCINTTV
jgi:hypothetical protein